MVSCTYSIHCALSGKAQTEISNDSQHKIPVGGKYHSYNVSLSAWKLVVLHKLERRPNVDKRTRNVAEWRKPCERRWQINAQRETLDNEWGAERKIKEIYYWL